MTDKRNIFLSVIEDHKGIIYKVGHSYCHDKETRKDLVQEIILQLWKSFDRYNNKYKYSTWVYRIALNTAISFYRNSKKRDLEKVAYMETNRGSIYETEQIDEGLDIQLLHLFIKELREIDRALILLYLEGFSQKEISEIIGVTATNVSTKINRIKKILKEKFKLYKSKYHE